MSRRAAPLPFPFPPSLLAGLSLACCLSGFPPAGRAAEGPVQVFLLAGQSNMEGQGVVSLDHPELYNGGRGNLVWSMQHAASRDRMRHLRDASGAWVVRDDVSIRFTAKGVLRQGGLTVGYTGYGGASHIGPELQFGHVLGDHLAEPVLLVKTAWGGKSLYRDFRPPGAPGDTGAFYLQMVRELREALADLEGRPHRLAGFVWQQGWNDMIDPAATAEYADNLVHLVTDLRAEFQCPDLPVVVGELGNLGPAQPGSGMDRFRQAQREGAARLAHCRFVETAAFARPPELSPNRGHGHHWFGNAESYFLIGDALGQAMKALLAR